MLVQHVAADPASRATGASLMCLKLELGDATLQPLCPQPVCPYHCHTCILQVHLCTAVHVQDDQVNMSYQVCQKAAMVTAVTKLQS